ncbi:MAG: hypothetical protein O7A03_06505 [Alphaproteobacteria bacterium]|nr:hypothetical protein [Alphaproteobacteria bacterium]
MRQIIYLAAALLVTAAGGLGVQVHKASAQIAPDGCNEFNMTDETNFGGFIDHTPMVLLACQNGMFMNYGPGSGHNGTAFLASTFNASANTLEGTVADYTDNTGCGPVSYTVNGELVDGQILYVSGLRPARISTNQPNACMITGEFEQVDRQFVLAEQAVSSGPPPPPQSFGPGDPTYGSTTSAGTGSGGSSGGGGGCGITVGTLGGAALGGFIGSELGGGKTAPIVGGVLLGGLIGSAATCP